jgi:glyoxylase-like metal-dependent hydrolase (beta-lactamase superfamily II)
VYTRMSSFCGMTSYTVHTYTAAERGLFVNSYLLESPDAVVLVDAGLLVPDARALAARIEALGKPLAAAFVTHAHPDHFNGLPFVAAPDVPVYATHEVADTIAAVAGPKRAQWSPVYGADWPAEHRVPEHRLGDGEPTLTDDAKARLTVLMTSFLPGAPLAWMIALGADAVAAELTAAALR